MNRIILSILAAFSLLTSGCDLVGIRGNGHLKTEQRAIGEITEIAASGAFNIEWHSGAPALSITTDENLLPYIGHTVSGSTLRFRTRERIRPSNHIKIVVSSRTLNGADLSGAVDLVARQVSGPKFYVRSRGAADITMDGNVEQLLADMTGASDLRAKSLQAKNVEISTTGASSAYITVTDTLRVSITGAGDVIYSGNPKTLEKHVTGAGSIRHRD